MSVCMSNSLDTHRCDVLMMMMMCVVIMCVVLMCVVLIFLCCVNCAQFDVNLYEDTHRCDVMLVCGVDLILLIEV